MDNCDEVEKDKNYLYKEIQGQKKSVKCVSKNENESGGLSLYGGQRNEPIVSIISMKN